MKKIFSNKLVGLSAKKGPGGGPGVAGSGEGAGASSSSLTTACSEQPRKDNDAGGGGGNHNSHFNLPQAGSGAAMSSISIPMAMAVGSPSSGGGGNRMMDIVNDNSNHFGRSDQKKPSSPAVSAGHFMLKKTGEGGGSGSGTGSGDWRGQQQQHGGGIQSAIQQRGMKKSGASSTTNLRRAPIRASAFVVDDHHGGSHTAEGAVKYVLPPVIPKDDASKALIYNAIKDNVLFSRRQKDNTKSSNNDTDELRDLIDAFVIKRCSKNDIIIQEGAQGDGFYVLSSGTVAVYESTAFKGNLYPGTGFGEIALLYSCPRTATVRAREDCDLWFMDRRAFRAIMSRHKRKRLDMKLMLLEKVKIHNKTLKDILKPHEIHSIAMAAKFEEYASGQVIVRQGGVGDAFYMIERGCVDVYIREKSQTSPVVTLKAGDFFGEKALLSSDVRTATCVAAPASRQGGEQQKAAGDGGGEGVVKCMVLMREDFVRMLGDLEYLLERSYEMRDGSERSMMMKTGGPKFQGMDTLVHPMSAIFVKSDFDIKRTLGVGAYGFVKLVRWNRAPPNQNEVLYALKCVSKEKIEERKQHQKIKREEDIMKSLIHPFIARCYNVMEDVKGKYFLMEALCGGELCELLYFEGKFSEDWSIFYSASVLAAFAHMHERKVAYRDLKPENLVLDEAGYVKIVDFGLAKVINNGQTYTFCGTPDYLAPEVILSEGHDWAVDYWGLGVLIYEMTEGAAPFYAENPMDTYRKALSGQVPIPDHFTVVVANLIKKLLHTDQSKRLGRTVGGTTAVMCHRWYANFDWDALLEYRMDTPYVPEVKDPDHCGENDLDGDVEGFASDFL